MKKVLAVLGLIAVAVAGLAVIAFTSMGESYDKVFEASEESGNIPEKTIGDPSKAKLVIYEYADYGCSHCAEWNATMTRLVNEYGGDLAVVFRHFDLGYQNGHTVALAATAAQLQGYWEEFKSIVFAYQEDWFYAPEDEIENILVSYFMEISNGLGDAEKFVSDMKSEAVEKRIQFENKIGNKVGVKGTPTFRMGGKEANLNTLEDKIAEKLKK